MNAILIVARKEFRDGLRNRWVLAVTLGFALFALGLAYFGAAASGQVGFSPLDTTIVSLASLAIFVIPLIALLLSYDTIVGEEERGTLLLLLSYPLGRGPLLMGKFAGQATILGVATVVGFGTAGLLIALLTKQLGDVALWSAFGFFIVSAILLGWVFIAFAHLISVSVSEKSRAAGLALLVWFVFVLIYDMALLGVLVATQGGVSRDVFSYLLLLNPTDVFRLANLAGFESARAYSGLTAVEASGLFRPAALLAVLAAWTAAPFLLALVIFKRRGA